MKFYKYLKACREYNHITQEELVNELYTYDEEIFESLDSVTLSRWERNTTKPQFPKQVSIIKYFQEKTDEPLPCWNHYSTEEVENLICNIGVQNLLGKTKQLVLNFPSEMMQVDDLKVYSVSDIEKVHSLFEINMDMHMATNDEYTQVSLEQFETWAMHPSNLFLVCEYKNRYIGLYFSMRVKKEVFNKLLNFEMKKSEITESDFALPNEVGSNFLLSFYALNHKVAMMLFVRYYAYLIANQNVIHEVGVATALDEVKKAVSNMKLDHYKNKVTDNSVSIEAYRQTLNKVLASEYVVKMIFSE